MINYRIDRIGAHRHTSTRIGAEFDHIDTAKQGQGGKYSFRVLILGRLLCNTDVSEAVKDVADAALYLLAGNGIPG